MAALELDRERPLQVDGEDLVKMRAAFTESRQSARTLVNGFRKRADDVGERRFLRSPCVCMRACADGVGVWSAPVGAVIRCKRIISESLDE